MTIRLTPDVRREYSLPTHVNCFDAKMKTVHEAAAGFVNRYA